MKSNYWRTAPRKYINFQTGLPMEQYNRKTSKNPFHNYEKFVVRSKETGKISTAIIFFSGKVAIGDDVWRLSNRADMCEHSYRVYLNRQLAEKYYDFLNDYPTYLVKRGESYAVS